VCARDTGSVRGDLLAVMRGHERPPHAGLYGDDERPGPRHAHRNRPRPAGQQRSGAGDFSIAVWDATIWRRDASGDWRIAVDISSLLPPSTT